jgi:hypothetical protein
MFEHPPFDIKKVFIINYIHKKVVQIHTKKKKKTTFIIEIN